MVGAAGNTPPVDPTGGVRPEPVGRSRPDGRRREAPPRPARSEPPAVEEDPTTRLRRRVDIVV